MYQVHAAKIKLTLVLRPLERDGSTSRNAVERIVVLVHEAAPQQILLFFGSGGVLDMLGNLGQIELVDTLPVRTNRHGSLPLDALAPPATSSASSATATTASATTAASATATAAGTVPTGALGCVLVRRLAGIGSLALLLGVQQLESIHCLALAGGSDISAGLRLGRVDELEGAVLLGIDLVLELGVGALPIAAEATAVALPLLLGMITRGEVGCSS